MNKPLAAATLVAALFANGCGPAAKASNNATQKAAVKCSGVNTCKGTSACAGKNPDGSSHDCAGKNSCAGQGFIEVESETACTSQGGSVIKV